jgi:ribosomal RNA-processing protein 12
VPKFSLSMERMLTCLQAFDQTFAELVSNLLYQQVDLRVDLCHALQMLVDSNNGLIAIADDDTAIGLTRISKEDAEQNIQHLATFSSNLLAVLFNVYTQTLPQYRGPILQCINAYLSITPEAELMETFSRVSTTLEASLAEANGQSNGAKEKEKPKKKEQPETQMPPMSHTLMDLVIAIAIYLPRASLAQLFGIATLMLQKDDPALQKKAYKMIPRLAESEMGKTALKERTVELQKLLLECAERTTVAARRDRLSAISEIVSSLPSSDLHFIPSVLPEVVICTKETNERARNAAFDLLVQMGEKMQEGGTIIQSEVPHMPSDAPSVPATLEEYITMVSAGLAGTVPHSVSASITGLTRILFHFRADLPLAAVKDLVETMDIFIKSPNREIVRSVMGFFKVCVISLDREMMLQRLPTLIPNLLKFGHEHKAALQAKVKHLFERLIRRFGYETVEKYTPAEDHKLIVNIRKTKERARKKKAGLAEDDDEGAPSTGAPARKGKFENEYDEAVYGSSGEESNSDSGSDVSDDEVLGRKQRKKKAGETYIVEDEEEPLDLLDRKALGHISSTRPQKAKAAPTQKRKAKTDLDGKLIFDDTATGKNTGRKVNDGEDVDMDGVSFEVEEQGDDVDLADGINAYVAAIKGRDVAKRGQRGKIKFSNRKDKDDDDEMEVDDEPRKSASHDSRKSGGSFGRGGRGMSRGGMDKRTQRRGLGAEKGPRGAGRGEGRVRGGRVMKSPRGGSMGRGRR